MENELTQEIATKFLCQFSLKGIKPKIHECLKDSFEIQEKLMQLTVLSDICRKFPLSIKYQVQFLKIIIDKLEEEGWDISGEVYEAFTELIAKDGVDNQRYRSFKLPSSRQKKDEFVVVQEAVQFVTHGTTGLQVWPAAQCLAEWALQNKCELYQKNVLELGCGIGFTGISIIKECCLSSYIFSDCHTRVLDQLITNLEINEVHVTYNTISKGEDTVGTADMKSDNQQTLDWYNKNEDFQGQDGYSNISGEPYEGTKDKMDKVSCGNGSLNFGCLGDYGADTSVSVVRLDWERIKSCDFQRLQPDIILASDVIYDSSIIDSFLAVLVHLFKLNASSQPVAYVASTIRNQDTYNQFMKSLESLGIHATDVPSPQQQMFFYDKSCPIKIIRLQLR